MNRLFCALPLLFLTLSSVAALKSSDENAAPAEDRVGYPDGYRQNFTVLRTFVKEKQKQVVTVYGNRLAASVTETRQLPYPYGSILVMETATSQAPDGKNNREVVGLHVMRREPGFGAGYGKNRTGEWEYVEYKADKSYLTPPQNSAVCAECHTKAGSGRDFVYRGRFPEASR